MWVSAITFDGHWGFIGEKTKKHQIEFFGFPLSHSHLPDKIIVTIAANIFGDSEDKTEFIKHLKGSSRVLELEEHEDFIVFSLEERKEAAPLYSSQIIHLSPVHINSKGVECIHAGSFRREELVNAISLLQRFTNVEVLYLREKTINNISFHGELPALTLKQKEAIQLALTKGYYEIPRQCSLEELASTMNLSYSTFQVHLRRAESKLMPFLFKSYQ